MKISNHNGIKSPSRVKGKGMLQIFAGDQAFKKKWSEGFMILPP